MTRFVSSRNTISAKALKRRSLGSVAIIRSGYEDINFTRVEGGWLRSRVDVTSEDATIVSSNDVANECNKVIGCRESWAKVYQSQVPTV